MKIICLGDSLTYGYGVPRQETWPALAEKKSGHTIINLGISGDTTAGMLARFNTEVLPQSPDAIVFMGGCNDIMTSGTAQAAKSNMAAIAHQSAARNIKPLLGTIPQIDAGNIRPDWAAFTDLAELDRLCGQYVLWLTGFAQAFRLTVVDFRKSFKPEKGQPVDSSLYLDVFHPSPKGHSLMADVLLRTLEGR